MKIPSNSPPDVIQCLYLKFLLALRCFAKHLFSSNKLFSYSIFRIRFQYNSVQMGKLDNKKIINIPPFQPNHISNHAVVKTFYPLLSVESCLIASMTARLVIAKISLTIHTLLTHYAWTLCTINAMNIMHTTPA